MRVLHIQKVKGIGGSERSLLSLLPGLAARGLDVRMSVLATREAARFIEPLRRSGVPVAEVPAGPDVNPVTAFQVFDQLRRSRPDIVHTHLVHADLYGQFAARLAGVPSVNSFHSSHAFYRREPLRTTGRVIGGIPRATVAISEFVAQFLRELGLARPGRIRLIPYGIDPPAWSVSAAERLERRDAWGIGPKDVAVGIASRLIPHKGHAWLLEAVRRARSQAPRIRLLVAGDGPLLRELRSRAESLPAGAVSFLGFVRDIGSFMSACDLLVFPTLPPMNEGFGLAALEAMAAGRPVIATRAGALPELVVDSDTGVLVEPGDVDALAVAMVGLALDRDRREAMGERGQRRAGEVFSLDRMIEAHLALYREVA